MNKIVWEYNSAPTNKTQNHYIFDEKWVWKTLWMKEQVEKNDDWKCRIYIDVKNTDYFKKAVEDIEQYFIKIWKKEEYDKEVEFIFDWNLQISDFSSFSLYLEFIWKLSKENIALFTLYIDNCDILSNELKQDLNTLIWYRERKIVYFLWINWDRGTYLYFTNSSTMVILENHDYFSRKIIDIL